MDGQTQNILTFILIFSLVASMAGVLFYESSNKKLACLSASYTNVIIILIFVSKNSPYDNEIFKLIPTLLILFSITLAIGFCISSNINKLKNIDQAN